MDYVETLKCDNIQRMHDLWTDDRLNVIIFKLL